MKWIYIATFVVMVAIVAFIAWPRTKISELRKPTALCKDGVYSYSQSRRGTCSGHDGVAKWF